MDDGDPNETGFLPTVVAPDDVARVGPDQDS